jgi:hypothetical protein
VDPLHTVWTELVLPVLATMDRAEVARNSGLSRRAFERYLYKEVCPHRRHEVLLAQIAVEGATAGLSQGGTELPRTDEAILHRYLQVSRAAAGKAGQFPAMLSESELQRVTEAARRLPSNQRW